MQSLNIYNKFYSILKESGEIGDLILSYDWSHTSIGEIDKWPLSLRNNLSNILRSSFPMFLFWGDELICFYNDAYRPSLGTDGKHPAIGKNGDKVWPEIWDFIGPIIKQVISTGKPAWFEDQLVPIYRNGKIEQVYWTFSYSPAFGDDSVISGVLVTCMETTKAIVSRLQIADMVKHRTEELEKAQTSLIKANEYLQNIINLSKEPLQVLEPVIENGKIIDFYFKLTNKAYSAYANSSPEFLQNKKVSEFFPGYLNTSSFINNVEVFNSGIANTWDIHYYHDGLNLHNRMSATKIGNELAVYFTDFTEVKHLQQELEKKIIELERSNKYLNEFAHAASHDLKEPVRKIQFFTRSLRDQLADQLKSHEIETFERIENAANRMHILIEDLLVYSEVSQLSPEKEEVNINDIIKQVLEDLDFSIQQKKAVITISSLPILRGNKRQLQQLFQNLIGNALKYGQKEKQVQISITASVTENNGLNYHLIKITDNGIGFEQQYADKIFDIFTRLHGKSEYNGNGVGLSIVKKVVENHGGSVKAESNTNEGSTFSVLLPAE
jgi:signal transduction histidine kinase